MSKITSLTQLTSEKCKNLEFLIFMKICNFLPQLEEEEKEKVIALSKEKMISDELRSFYEVFRQKNKIALFSIDIEDLDNYYIYKIVQEYIEKNIFSNNFNFINFLSNGKEITQFKLEIENKLIEPNIRQEIFSEKSSLTTFSFDASFIKITSGVSRDVFNNLVKFNLHFHTGSVHLNFFMLYPQIEEDLVLVLSNITPLNKLIIKFNEKYDWSEDEINSGVFSEIYRKNLLKVNGIIKCIFSTVEKCESLPVILLLSESKIKIEQENADLIFSIIEEKNTKILSIKNLTFPERKKFNKHITDNSQLAYFNQEGIEFTDYKAENFMTNFMKKSIMNEGNTSNNEETPSYRRVDLL